MIFPAKTAAIPKKSERSIIWPPNPQIEKTDPRTGPNYSPRKRPLGESFPNSSRPREIGSKILPKYRSSTEDATPQQKSFINPATRSAHSPATRSLIRDQHQNLAQSPPPALRNKKINKPTFRFKFIIYKFVIYVEVYLTYRRIRGK